MMLRLPYPPTVNSYWRRAGRHMHISTKGKKYRQDVAAIVLTENTTAMTGRLSVVVDLHPPDRRKRDLDNVLKSLLDAMEHSGVYEDDNQIDELTIRRAEVLPDGEVIVWFREVS